MVFICGAGISRPKDGANLPDFHGLTKKVMKCLRVRKGNSAKKMLQLYKREYGSVPIPFDSIFSELEREYSILDIEYAICQSLACTKKVNKRYHNMIRDLATSLSGDRRLITTNFDGLFSHEEEHEYIYPDFPKVDDVEGFSGLVYLHGKCKGLKNSRKSNLVFSTRSFGEAYVADGNVTDFLKGIFARYTIVFVGYAADDMPMRYLLHALSRSGFPRYDVYAFHIESQVETQKKWQDMGVKAICFNSPERLWETLDLWHKRAFEFDEWAGSVLKTAQQDPLSLQKWQISQVIHLASHEVGANLIAKCANPIHEKWLLAFDKKFRQTMWPSSMIRQWGTDHYNPFRSFVLENFTDVNNASSGKYAEHSIKDINKLVNDWDIFEFSPFDKVDDPNKNPLGRINGGIAEQPRDLTDRHKSLARWITNISVKPMTARWAIHQVRLHPTVREEILRTLRTKKKDTKSIMLKVWEDIFESWKTENPRAELDLHTLHRIVNRSNWTPTRIQQYESFLKPRLQAVKYDKRSEVLQKIDQPDNVNEVVDFDVKYNDAEIEFSEFDNLEVHVLQADRRNLDYAIELEQGRRFYVHHQMPAIMDSMSEGIPKDGEVYGITKLAFRYLKRFHRILERDMDSALREYLTWPKDDKNIYKRFEIWAIGDSRIVPDADIGKAIIDLPHGIFWENQHNRDLRHVLSCRWSSISKSDILSIEDRIVSGDIEDGDDNEKESIEGRAQKSLNMLQLLSDSQCTFSPTIEDKIKMLKSRCANWSPQVARDFESMLKLRGGIVKTNTNYDALKNVPKDEIIDIADDNSGYDVVNQERHDPFRGCCESEPDRAIAALKSKASCDDYPKEHWGSWFHLNWESMDYKKYLPQTTKILSEAADEKLIEMNDYVYPWFWKVAHLYCDEHRNIRDMLFKKLFSLLASSSVVDKSGIERRVHEVIKWETEAINAPAGQLARALLNYREFLNLSKKTDLSAHWYKNAADLLSLNGDSGLYALVVFAQQIQKLHWCAAEWTRKNIMRYDQCTDNHTLDAYWEGFSKSIIREPSLFLEIKKPLLERILSVTPIERHVLSRLSSFVFRGWITAPDGKRLLKNRELENVLYGGSESFRECILRNVRDWEKNDKDGMDVDYPQEICDFVMNVWPLSEYVISEVTNVRLVEILISYPDLFNQISDRIMPKLRNVRVYTHDIRVDREKASTFARRYPDALLEILSIILPHDRTMWPQVVSGMLDIIAETDNSLTEGDRFRSIRDRLTNYR